MYKIYINDNPLYLMNREEMENVPEEEGEIYPYTGRKKQLLQVIDRLEKSDTLPLTALYAADAASLVSDFESLFEEVSAAGGIVENADDEILFIFRRDRWDLPKGKQEAGETDRESAAREVTEETGLNSPVIREKIGETRHTYKHPVSGKRILKITHWFRMSAPASQELIPQKEEDIEEAKWMSLPAFIDGKYITFTNIKDILSVYESLRK